MLRIPHVQAAGFLWLPACSCNQMMRGKHSGCCRIVLDRNCFAGKDSASACVTASCMTATVDDIDAQVSNSAHNMDYAIQWSTKQARCTAAQGSDGLHLHICCRSVWEVESMKT